FECGYYKVMNLSSLSFFKALHLIHRLLFKYKEDGFVGEKMR
ncbi:MAG: hypothetical protein ACI9JY_001689, partial [Saprospiraceae bacterium]